MAYDTGIRIDTGQTGLQGFEINEIVTISVYLIDSDNNETDITNDPDAIIFSKDDNIIWDDTNKQFQMIDTGHGILKAIYTNASGNVFSHELEPVGYEPFFRDNYLKYLVSSFDASKIKRSPKAKMILDTIFEWFDVLYAYAQDASEIASFSKSKSKMLEALAQNTGFERIDFEEIDTIREEASLRTFKELINNMQDLLGIRGTELAYELFFGALGYSVNIEEFWYNDDGDLVEINTRNETQSTYYRYNTSGNPVDNPQVPVPDPRRFTSPENPYNVNTKSNYMRVILSSKNTDIATPPGSFTPNKKLIISRYLEFLRPSHMQYLQELLSADLSIEELNDIVDGFNAKEWVDAGTGNTWLDDSFDLSAWGSELLLGQLSELASEELSFRLKWDSGIKWDSGVKWDESRTILDDFFAVTV